MYTNIQYTKYILALSVLTFQSDITKRKHVEEKIKNLLAEKNLFIKEVHHRIKNNMSTVVGLLALQSSTLKDSSAVEALLLAKSRVQSMMLLYDKLYRSEDFKQMSIREYISPLVDDIAEVHGKQDVFLNGKCGDQLEKLKDDSHILSPPTVAVFFLKRSYVLGQDQ